MNFSINTAPIADATGIMAPKVSNLVAEAKGDRPWTAADRCGISAIQP